MDTSIIVGLLVIAGVWAVYLMPRFFGDRRDAPLNSTEEFDRWTHSMAYAQRMTPGDLANKRRDLIHSRRRRTMMALGGLTALSLFGAWRLSSLPLLVVSLFFGSLIALYMTLLAQIEQRRRQALKVTHVAQRKSEWEESRVRVIGG